MNNKNEKIYNTLSPLERAGVRLKVCGMKYNTAELAMLQPDYLGFIFYDKSPRDFEGTIPELPKGIKKVGVFVNEEISNVIEKITDLKLDAVQLHGSESPEYCKNLKESCHSALTARPAGRDAESTRSDEKLNSGLPNKSEVKHDEMRSHFQHSEKSKNEISQSQSSFRNDKYNLTVISSGVEIIKVFSIKNEFDFSVLESYEDVCDYYLFDTKGKLPGGNGYAFDWSVLKNYPSTKPYFLSGGIGIHEIDNVLSFLHRQESRYCYAIDVNSKFELKPGLKDIEQLNEFKNKLSFRT